MLQDNVLCTHMVSSMTETLNQLKSEVATNPDPAPFDCHLMYTEKLPALRVT